VAQDDWRVTVRLRDAAEVGRLRRALHERDVEEDVRTRLGTRVAVGEGDHTVFLYASTGDAAHEAARVTSEVVAAHGLTADIAVDRWHPVEERWEDEGVPLPMSEAERQAERERLAEDEIAQSEELGGALWEVRVELDSHQDAIELADRLVAERDTLVPGWTVSVVRRWKYLLIGADNEDQANQIARRLQDELPDGAQLEVEPSGTIAWQARPSNPFAVFGGLGG
jgi:hypothetical protein